ncbi:serine hydrolase domain-containing protein [Nocardia sp. NPDC059246]|uniref:serine hydrolase domain-containing protein n=1 Tax=unclassified Nocardia TaxID=2637762 RepID=UPI003689CCB2
MTWIVCDGFTKFGIRQERPERPSGENEAQHMSNTAAHGGSYVAGSDDDNAVVWKERARIPLNFVADSVQASVDHYSKERIVTNSAVPATAANAAARGDASPAPERGVRLNRPATLEDWARLNVVDDWSQPAPARWAYRHVRELVPTARVARGDQPAPLPRAETSEQLPGIAELMQGETTDGLLVLHNGTVVFEEYAHGMRVDDTHIVNSVTKSLVGTLAGVLVERGALTPEDEVVKYVPELAGTSYEGASVRHLLDMRTGTSVENKGIGYTPDVDYWEEWGAQFDWTPGTPSDQDAIAFIASFINAREHGGPFEYRSILTDLLGLVLERAADSSLAELLGQELWAPMGAEWDADLAVNRHGFAPACAGISTTLRDLARFGQLMLDNGTVDGRQIVPAAWIEDTFHGGLDSAAAFAGSKYEQYFPSGQYRNQWWVPAPGRVLLGLGSGGQHLYVDRAAGVSIAHVSTMSSQAAKKQRVASIGALRSIADHLSVSAPRI